MRLNTDLQDCHALAVGRWKIDVTSDEVHSMRCAIAVPLYEMIACVCDANRHFDLLCDTNTEHNERLAKAGMTAKGVWLEFGGVRLEMSRGESLRLWKTLQGFPRPRSGGESLDRIDELELQDMWSGRDEFSKLSLSVLQQRLPKECGEIEQRLPIPSEQGAALRWVLRGLTVQRAVWKIVYNRTVVEKKRNERRKAKFIRDITGY